MVSHSSSLYRKSVALKILECSLVLLIWVHASKFLWEIVERLCWSVTLLLDFTSYFCKISASMARTFFSTYFDIFVGNYNNGFLASIQCVFSLYFLVLYFLVLIEILKNPFRMNTCQSRKSIRGSFCEETLRKVGKFQDNHLWQNNLRTVSFISTNELLPQEGVALFYSHIDFAEFLHKFHLNFYSTGTD